MLLMAPITIEIALMLEINPTALIIPEALAAEVGGTATLIGDPPNTVIGSFADLGFNQFLIHMGPIALIATITLMAVIYLIYRYVVDLRFLDKTAAPIVVDVENEVTKMGQFLLLMAKERAAEQSVAADTICCKGKFREELKKAACEEGVSLVVLGRPAGEESVFKLASLEAFAAEIEAETGVEAVIV